MPIRPHAGLQTTMGLMNSQKLLWTAGALLIAIILSSIWLFRKLPEDKSLDANQNATAQQAELGQVSQSPTVSSRPSQPQAPVPLNPSGSVCSLSMDEKRARDLALAANTKNVPISFWGKVVDQDRQPLSGVRVVMRIRQWSFHPTSGPQTLSPRHESISDIEGNFQFTGSSGDSLELESVTKDGYLLSPKTQSGYLYGSAPDCFRPDASSPVVIRMWKLMPTENLVSFRTLFGFVPDGRDYVLDLLANKKLLGERPEGDLLVKWTRPTQVEPRQKYDWMLELGGINGGLVEAVDDFGFLAPENGYQPKVTIRYRAADSNWTDSITKDFYIRSRGGAVYGRLHLNIHAEYNGQSAVFFETRLNAGGSRNLQPR